MYKRLLLATDGAKEGLVALREGALIAQSFRAEAHLLIIDPATPALRIAESHSQMPVPLHGDQLLELGLHRLKHLGVTARGEILRGDAVQLITDRVKRLDIDLIVLGHKRRSFLDRWWSGESGGYIVDNVNCSILVARDTISDDEFEQRMG